MGRILSLDFFSDLLEETRAQFADTSEIDLKLAGYRKSLSETERGINMMLAAIEKGAISAVDRLKELEIEQIRLKSEIEELETQIISAQVAISPEALTLALNTWCHQLDKASNTRELKNLIARFVSKIELDYNMARIWYKYPLALEESAPTGGHTIKKTVLRMK